MNHLNTKITEAAKDGAITYRPLELAKKGKPAMTATWVNRSTDANIWDDPATGDAITVLGDIYKLHRAQDFAADRGDGGQSWSTDPRDFHRLAEAQSAAGGGK